MSRCFNGDRIFAFWSMSISSRISGSQYMALSLTKTVTFACSLHWFYFGKAPLKRRKSWSRFMVYYLLDFINFMLQYSPVRNENDKNNYPYPIFPIAVIYQSY